MLWTKILVCGLWLFTLSISARYCAAITASGMSLLMSLMPMRTNSLLGFRFVTSASRARSPKVMSAPMPRLITVLSPVSFAQSPPWVMLLPRKITRPVTTGSASNFAMRLARRSGMLVTVS
jgi:hypothetical protein